MSTLTNEQVVEYLSNLTVMEVIALTRQLEQDWKLEAIPVPTVVQDSPVEIKPVVEQTEFTVSLISFPADKKIAMVKLIREVVGLGLVESKNLVESLPKILKDAISKEDVEALKAKFAETGAILEVK